jgi:quinol monooxygenase YgiN
MIIHQITITPKEGKQKAAVELLVNFVKDVRKEKGCKMAELYALHEQHGDLMIRVDWKDENALIAHKQSEHFKTFQRDSISLIEEQRLQTLTHLPVVIKNDQHPLDEIYDFVYDLSLSIPFAGTTTKKILEKVHMREVGKGFMAGFKPFYPKRMLEFVGKKAEGFFTKGAETGSS